MSFPFAAIAVSAGLAGGFAAVGELVLRRRSTTLTGWNESFLAGAGICAAALFPLSVVAPTRALLATAVLMALATLWILARRLALGAADSRGEEPKPDAVTRVLIAATGLVALCFAALDLRYNYYWDGFLIWATKAQLLFARGGLSRTWFPADVYELRHVSYPPLVPLFEALLALLRGGFDFDELKPVFLVFFLSLLVSTYAAARAASSPRLGAVAALMVGLVPALATRHAAGGYADMPQAAILAGVVAACLRADPRALPWLVGALTTVKSEGMILAAIASGGILVCRLVESADGAVGRGTRLARAWRGAAIVAGFVASRLLYARWVGAPETDYAPLDASSIAQAWHRVPRVASLCLRELLDFGQWGLLWPAFLAAAALLIARGNARDRCLAVGTAVTVGILAVPFLFSRWPIELHVEQAYFRLLAQVAPAAVIVTVVGYARASAGRDGRAAAPTGA